MIIFFELSSSLNFAVHTGSIGGIIQDYTASQFLVSTKRRLEPIACLLIRLANQNYYIFQRMPNMLASVNLIFKQKRKLQSFSHVVSFQVQPAHSQSIMLDLCLCEESKACHLIYNMIICSLLFWILVSTRTLQQLIFCFRYLWLHQYISFRYVLHAHPLHT